MGVRGALFALVAASLLLLAPDSAPAQQGQKPAPAPEYAYRKAEVHVSEAKIVELGEAVDDLFLADPSIADLQAASPSSFYLHGKRPGRTTVIGYGKGRRIISLVDVEVSYDLRNLNTIIEKVAEEADITTLSTPNGVLLRGAVDSPLQARTVRDVTLQYLTSVGVAGAQLVDEMTVRAPNQVNLQVRIVEISRSAGEYLSANLGIGGDGGARLNLGGGGSLGGAIGGRNNPLEADLTGANPVFTVGRGSQPLTGDLTNLISFIVSKASGTFYALLDILEREGLVVTFAQPNLTALSGETASFLAGGEVPIPSFTQQGAFGVEFREFGVILSFTPTILSDGRIAMSVLTEVSEVSRADSITAAGISIPGFATRRTKTAVELASGQSFAIAGMLQRDFAENVRQIPGLSQLPIIGALTRSDDFASSESELVVLITPLVVEPVDPAQARSPLERVRFNTLLERWLTGRMLSYEPDATFFAEDEAVAVLPRYLEVGGFMLE